MYPDRSVESTIAALRSRAAGATACRSERNCATKTCSCLPSFKAPVKGPSLLKVATSWAAKCTTRNTSRACSTNTSMLHVGQNNPLPRDLREPFTTDEKANTQLRGLTGRRLEGEDQSWTSSESCIRFAMLHKQLCETSTACIDAQEMCIVT
eukprot:TRINITY_DN9707_c0_g1_i2.p1 TRINITY_DN9707_c0_g1~~TRINITY_DN9707_c0_g1_i2.p1  ORF type:complete len:152 (+),score=8.49 TRINITY_DN9707_c0_g1_i2:157-612(+)